MLSLEYTCNWGCVNFDVLFFVLQTSSLVKINSSTGGGWRCKQVVLLPTATPFLVVIMSSFLVLCSVRSVETASFKLFKVDYSMDISTPFVQATDCGFLLSALKVSNVYWMQARSQLSKRTVIQQIKRRLIIKRSRNFDHLLLVVKVIRLRLSLTELAQWLFVTLDYLISWRHLSFLVEVHAQLPWN